MTATAANTKPYRYTNEKCPNCGKLLLQCCTPDCEHEGCNGEGYFCEANLVSILDCKWKSFTRQPRVFGEVPEVEEEIGEFTDEELEVMTALEYKTYLRARRDSGNEVFCDCCSQRSHADGRPFDLTLLRGLNCMRQYDDANSGEFVKMADLLNMYGLNKGNVAALIRHWRLIEAQSEERRPYGTDPHALYRITALGRSFLKGEAEIPRMAYTYQGRVYGWSDSNNRFEGGKEEWITVADLAEFDYNELFLRN